MEIVFTKDCTQTVLLISLIKTQFVTEEQIRAHHDFFARKDTTLIFQNLHTNNQHPISDVDSVAKGSLNMIIFTPSSQLLRKNLLILPCVCLGHLFVNFPYLIIRVLSSSFILVSKKNICIKSHSSF